jgi:hypothetical protein
VVALIVERMIMMTDELIRARSELEMLESALNKTRMITRDRTRLERYLKSVKQYIATGNLGAGKYWVTPFGGYACRNIEEALRLMDCHRKEMSRNIEALLDRFRNFVQRYHIFPRSYS